MRRLHVVIPFYNEQNTLEPCVRRVLAAPLPDGWQSAIYLVDDASDEPAAGAAAAFAGGLRAEGHAVSLRRHDVNRGKGAAVRGGFDAVLAANPPDDDLVIIQDADLEYDPAEHNAMLAPIINGRADAVIGTRFLGQTHRVLYYWHSIGNRGITMLSNMLSNLNLTDIECGFKAFSRDTLKGFTITELRFGVEPEIIAKLAKATLPADTGGVRKLRIFEVPISYDGRTYEEGKKIGWRDGFEALWCIVKHNIGN